jgi:hypothetical protein
MPHRVALVPMGDQVHAWVLDLPGCIAGARDTAELADRLPLVIAEYLAWLHEHGERISPATDWTVVETVAPHIVHATGGDVYFAADRDPISHMALELTLTRVAYARTDLLASIGSLPDAVLDWVPPRTSVAQFDTWAPEVRTMRDVINHVLSFEVYYREGLQDGPAKGIFEPVADAERERTLTLNRLRSLSDAQRTYVFQPVRPGQTAPEQWTVRKLLRRLLAHERVHTAELRQRRTWLLLGVPPYASQP